MLIMGKNEIQKRTEFTCHFHSNYLFQVCVCVCEIQMTDQELLNKKE